MTKSFKNLYENEHLKLLGLATEPYGTNTYLVICKESRQSVLIDAPGEVETILATIRAEELQVLQILISHGHLDHTPVLIELQDALGVKVAAHRADAAMLPRQPEVFLSDGETVSVGSVALKVIHTPGHTPGGLCFLSGEILIAGDTLFPGGPGRTDSPAAFSSLLTALKTKLLPLPDQTRFFPGHGDGSTIGQERPAIEAFLERDDLGELYGEITWQG